MHDLIVLEAALLRDRQRAGHLDISVEEHYASSLVSGSFFEVHQRLTAHHGGDSEAAWRDLNLLLDRTNQRIGQLVASGRPVSMADAQMA
ncbi:MAG: hypothetical protein M3Q69_15960, partial [Acidobacteriota bacterium]|nr:hypothetical protein [Acidobacteriota bacterium]